MDSLVIYDSMFGNTEKIARAVGDGLRVRTKVRVVPAGRVREADWRGAALVVVGSPTRGFLPTDTLVQLLRGLDAGALGGTWAGAFDTRYRAEAIESVWLRFVVRKGGYAAERIAAQLQRAGARLVAPPEGFFVENTEGPLEAGELERAAGWASQLLAHADPLHGSARLPEP